MAKDKSKKYKPLADYLFFQGYKKGSKVVPFTRAAMLAGAETLKIDVGNYGDVIYSLRYRTPMPDSILKTQPKGMQWIIEGAGRSLYEFRLVPVNRIGPNPNLVTIKIPDATPEIIAHNALSDEQALLAKVRYNRLLDIFLGLTTYSLQNHLRTTVKGIGQIEIDEIYIGVDRRGCQYVLPVQAKGGKDQLSVVQARQDIACCAEKFPQLVCRAISAQFMDESKIALFELTTDEAGLIRIVDEKHYQLVPADLITSEDLDAYRL